MSRKMSPEMSPKMSRKLLLGLVLAAVIGIGMAGTMVAWSSAVDGVITGCG